MLKNITYKARVKRRRYTWYKGIKRWQWKGPARKRIRLRERLKDINQEF